MPRFFAVLLAAVLTLLCAYPVAACLQHGLEPMFWPPEVIQPAEWFTAFSSLHWSDHRGSVLANCACEHPRRSPMAAGRGLRSPPSFPLIVTLAAPAARRLIQRDESDIFGSARFANDAERAIDETGPRAWGRSQDRQARPDSGARHARYDRAAAQGQDLRLRHSQPRLSRAERLEWSSRGDRPQGTSVSRRRETPPRDGKEGHLP